MRCSLRSVLTLVASLSFVLIASESLWAAPVISSLNPTSGATGTSVVITGSNFGSTQGTSTVKFAGVVAAVTNWSNTGTSITATVPSGIPNGNETVVVTVGGVQSNGKTFTVTNPSISGLSINSAPVDQEITINGSNFGSSQGSSTVTFNSTSAIPSFWNTSSIVVPVPTGATTGNIVVTVSGNATLPVPFMVTPAPPPPGVQFIQGNYATPVTSSASITVPFPVEQNSGDLNVVIIAWHDTTTAINSVTDSAGNSYSLAVSGSQSTLRSQQIYYAKNIFGVSTNSITIAFSAAPTRPEIRIGEYSGLDRTSPLDVVKSSTGTSSTPDSGLATTTNAIDLLIGADVADSVTTVPGTSYTNRVITYTASNLNADIFEDRIVTAIGSYKATTVLSTSRSWIMQMVAFKEATNQAPVVSAGPNQAITLPTNSVILNGTATDDGLPNNTLTFSWTKVSGPGTVTFTSPSTATTQATFSTAGIYVLQLTANDSQLSGSSNVTITVNAQPTSLVLTPSIAGPDVTGTTQTMSATLTIANTGTPISGASVQFTVTGPNATSGNSTTNSSGIATFSYVGSNQGTDTVQSSSNGTSSNSASVSWITPVQPISTSTIFGRFFTSNGSGIFNIPPTATPVFTQEFPTINFDPPAGTIPGNTSGVNVNTRPFTDVTTDLNGNFTGTIVAQGNGFQAGAGSLNGFQAVFTGAFTVKNAGNITINMFSDDGFVLGINNISGNVSRVSGPMINVPTGGVTPFQQYTVVASFNQPAAPTGNTLVVNFLAPGTYQYELDYTECCGGQDVLTMAVGTPSSTGAAPTGSLALTPTNPASINTGQTETLTVQASDASGASIPNLGVAFIIDGANMQFLNGTTNSSGQATLQYTGVHGGTDTVQAVANITGMGSLSNVVTVAWNVPAGGGCSTYIFTPQGWISTPAIGAVVQGQVPITLASGITLTSGTLKMFPTANPNQVTVLNSNTTGTGPLTLGTIDATLLANGEYTIQLQATTSTVACQLNEIVVSVTGQSKLGRKTVSVTDFTVPLAGIPINITRTYDSLNRGTVGDLGNGWNLGTNVQLSVDQLMDVTFTWNGKRQTFYFTPQSNGSALFPWLLVPHYTPQPGLFGTLTSNGCSALMQVGGALLQDTTGVFCFPSGTYQPTIYTYTDPAGRAYTISSSGQLQSIKDLNGNTLTVAANGITSSVNGVVIPFIRDGSGRITQITDLNNKNYTYSYDGNGNLQSVQYPGLTQAETYTYATDHSLLTETDPRGNTSSATYYDSTNDGGNSQLDGRLKSFTQPTVSDGNGNPVQYTTQYAYNLTSKITTITNPDGGTVTRTDDSFGNPLSITEQVNGSTSRTTTYQYDSKENLVKIIHPCGNSTCSDTTGNDTWNYTYDANGFQTSIQDPLSHTSTKTYNQFGGVLTSTDAANTNTETITYDAFLNPVQTTDLLNGAGTLVNASTFDALGNLLTSTDANNKTTQLAYDPNGNLIQVTDSLNQATRYTYDLMDRIISQSDPLNNTTQVTYDALGRLKTKTDALGKTTTYNYDNNGNKTSETDANNHTTQYQYDALNRMTQITYPDTTTKQYRYDFRGNKLVEIDQSGRTTKYIYDLAGQLTSMTYAFGTADAGTMSYAYDLDGRKQTITDERNNITTNTYDAAGNLATVKDALNHTTNYAYDADNRKTSVQDANLNTTGYAYDKRSRLTTITYPATGTQGATTTQYTYDGMGRQLITTDQAGKVTTKTYDAVGRLTSVKDGLNNTTNYSYDAGGNMTFLQDAAGRVTSYQHDNLNRPVVRILPLGQSEVYAYDAVGNLATKTDFNGLKTTYTYDTLNRLLSKVPQSGTGITFTYTPTGQRLTMTDPSGTTNYTYDNRDRLLTKATPEGTLTYTYDAHGNALTIDSSNTNGASVTYSYDALNRLASAKDNRVAAQGGPSSPTTYSYDAAGNLSGYLYPNTVQTSNVFDQLNRLTQTCSATSAPACSAGSKLSSYAYTLGNAGNRSNAVELNSRSVAYGYDNDYRLISEAITADPSGNNGTVSYVYDAVGNRFSMTSTLNAVPGGSFSYDANDRLTTDLYDLNGNTTSSGSITNFYDFENRITQHGSIQLQYDGDGNRVSETIGGTTTKYLVDDHNPTHLPQVLDELVNGSVTRTYAYGLQRITENQQISGTWTPRLYGYDGHGNVRFLSNTAGSVTDSYDYDVFGMPIKTSGTTPNGFLYSGERFDNSIGLYDLRARYYNQATGRFWTRDPLAGNILNPVTLHKYVYVENNPCNAVDPTGLTDIEEYTIGIYNRLRVAANRVGLEAHHILPKRFACLFEISSGLMMAVALTPANHQYYDNLWEELAPYKGGKSCLAAADVLAVALEVYEDDPDILLWLKYYFQLR
jgi:RHS repeat-associated protein